MKKTKNSDSNLKKETITENENRLKVGESSNARPPPQEPSGGQSEISLTPFGSISGLEKVYDCMAYVFHCTQHSKIALTKGRAVWLPFVAITANKTWKEVYSEGALQILSSSSRDSAGNACPDISHYSFVEQIRVEVPEPRKVITRLMCYVKLTASAWKCCQNSELIEWFTISDILDNKVPRVWGPEVCEFVRKIKTNTALTCCSLGEFGVRDALFYSPSDAPRTLEQAFLKSASINTNDIERLYGSYIYHCFPCAYMTEFSFETYIKRVDKSEYNYRALFNAFASSGNQWLNFHELLFGLASFEPSTPTLELRLKFVFRYYDTDRDHHLNNAELKALVTDIACNGNKSAPKPTDKEIEAKVSEAIKTIKTDTKTVKQSSVASLVSQNVNSVSMEEFYQSVYELRFRGTSSLCHAQHSIIARISMSVMGVSSSVTSLQQQSYHSRQKYRGICMACKQKSYEYACHIVRLDHNSRCTDAIKMFEPDIADDTHDIKGYRYSIDFVFNTRCVANVLIDMIRDFNGRKGVHSRPNGFMAAPNDREDLPKYLQYLCDIVKQIVSREERAVKVNSPCFVIGDIHGNLEDLLTIEKLLWPSVPVLSANAVFLGNYVGKGKWGVECVIYLFALKILAPNKFFLLRGNHEIRAIQQQYTFKTECCEKYGKVYGQKVFDIINNVFDCLPLCAVVDEAIYCAHGGIPRSAKLLAQINAIKNELRDPERDSDIAWEIMWNDPISNEDAHNMVESFIKKPADSSFLENGRCTNAYLFTEKAVVKFLKRNQLSHIIRGHGVPQPGHAFDFGGKCVTIFSCSHYCGKNNESAVILVADEKIRIVRLDTANNAPASD